MKARVSSAIPSLTVAFGIFCFGGLVANEAWAQAAAWNTPRNIVRVPDMPGGSQLESKGDLPLDAMERWPESQVIAESSSAREVALMVGYPSAAADQAVAAIRDSLEGRPARVLVSVTPYRSVCHVDANGNQVCTDDGGCDPCGSAQGACGDPLEPGARWSRVLAPATSSGAKGNFNAIARSPLMEQQIIRALIKAGVTDVQKLGDDDARILLASAGEFPEGLPKELLAREGSASDSAPRVILAQVQGRMVKAPLIRESGDEPTYALTNVAMVMQVHDSSSGAVASRTSVDSAETPVDPAGCYCPGVCFAPGSCQGCCSGCCTGCCTGMCSCCWY